MFADGYTVAAAAAAVAKPVTGTVRSVRPLPAARPLLADGI